MFKDFAVWGVTGPVDPQISFTRSGASTTSGGVGQPWTRPYVTFVPDRDAKYLSVGARILAMNQASVGSEHLQSQHFTQWQLERERYGLFAPRDYTPARQVQVAVKADRINQVQNPAFINNASGWSNHTNATLWLVPAPTYSPGGALQVTCVDGSTPYMTARTMLSSSNQMAAVRGNETYAAQIRFRPDATIRNVRVSIEWYAGANGSGGLISTVDGAQVTEVAGQWVLASVVAEAPENATGATLLVTVLGTATNESHFVDNALFERASTVLPFFDGSYGDDYVWEIGGNAGNSRSYYYENRLARGEALTRALRDTVPIGIAVAAPQFGIFTE